MIAVIQRVKQSSVAINGSVIGRIGGGMLTLLGVAEPDTVHDVDFLTEKLVNLRIFEDKSGKMNRSLVDIHGEMLVVSQFTLLADCKKGRRPSFVAAARPEKAIPLYERFIEQIRKAGLPVQTGQFGAMMDVTLINDGPVTLIVESK
ncbi:MAG TPA: D-aminoacyl-tRNA deacylase [Desulfatirhabdiaceae bacterium]|nr:D-aminoacyl-tRNA deacylase [Desulfatirhabdiaceae bacterium]